MPESFGTRLRRQREGRNLTLSSIAEHTKIHQTLLEELERDEVSHWPSGIFRRAFIRAYADTIGLDPDEVVREFLTVHPDPIEVVSIGAAMATVASTKRRPPTRLSYSLNAALEAVLHLLRRLFGQNGANAQETASTQGTPSTARTPRTLRTLRTFDPDLLATGLLCTRLAQAEIDSDVSPLLHEAARILDAVGVIVWAWDPGMNGLTPVAADGYADRVLRQLPVVRLDADNATAAAYRSGQTCAVSGGERATSALAVPVMAPGGCVGVLTVELPNGAETAASLRAVATMIAAQMGRLVEPMSRRPERFGRSSRPPSSGAIACA